MQQTRHVGKAACKLTQPELSVISYQLQAAS